MKRWRYAVTFERPETGAPQTVRGQVEAGTAYRAASIAVREAKKTDTPEAVRQSADPDRAGGEDCPDCGGRVVGMWTLDGLHFDGTCPQCGSSWAIRLATGR